MLGLGIGVNKRRFASGGAPPAYTPLDDSDLFAWWDAQAGTTTSGGELTAWLDRKANITANPPTVTSRPLYATNQINGLDVLTFRSTDPNYLQIDVSTLNTGNTIHIVLNQNAATVILLGDDTNNNASIFSQSGNTNPADRDDLFGGSVIFYKNGVLLGTDITRADLYSAIVSNNCILSLVNVDLTNITNYLQVGARAGLSSSFDGLISDIIISSSNTFFAENLNYLIDKYGF